MIPVKLALRNFMPYRGNLPPLRFEGIHIACITGDNGSGKSALIDAITWAVWGRTRARSGSDDDLIHLGQSDMEVEFDFTSGPNLYRIIRKHSRPKLRARSGQTALEFQVTTGDGFQAISGNSITQTQQKIIATLRMDYDTFINSAFLRQGHADEFTIKGPAERKQVLADILGFSLYDELEERAKELARQRETEKAQLEIAVADIDKELLGRPACETELAHGQQELSRIELIVKETESRLNVLRQEKGSLENKKAQLAQVERQIAGYQRDLNRWAEQVKQHRSRLEEYAVLIAGRTAIEDGYRQFTEARRLYDELSQKSVAVLRLNERKSDLEKAIDRAQSVLLTEHTVLENRINELETIFQKLSQLKDELQGTQNEWNRLAGVEVALLQKRQASQDLRALVHQAESSNVRLEKEIGEIEDKLRLLLTGGAHKCPLCESELGVEGLKLIEAKYTADKSGKHSSLNLGEEELARHRLGLKSLEDEVRHLEVSLKKDGAAIQSKTSLLNKAIAEAVGAGDKLDQEKVKLGEIEGRLSSKNFATVEQRALAELERELARIDYDLQQHEAARQRLITLQQYETPKRRLEEADRSIGQEREAAVRAEEAVRELEGHLKEDNHQRAVLGEELARLPRLVSGWEQAEAEHQALTLQQKQAQERIWQAQTKLERLASLEILRKDKEKQLLQSANEMSVHRELAQAFGKKGIQALLIEQMALPEIEEETNRLLGRMTDNRMHVKFETQRPTRTGDLMETLDINISDELGTRNYEMFSGGEAFRINFAIRIALSKLLARRAGAPLPTLIIDEGFGTQDAAGIEKVKEAINSIQDDFDKILVITHVEELRDAFPTRINVVKTAEGSILEVT